MRSQHFTTTLLVDQTPEVVFEAVKNVSSWWYDEIEKKASQLNDEFVLDVKGIHYSRQKLVEVVPGKRIVWLVTESNLTFIKDRDEWTGTKIIFDITRKDSKTQLDFTHEGLLPEVECYQVCSSVWTKYIQHSLQRLIETGKGDPTLGGSIPKSPNH